MKAPHKPKTITQKSNTYYELHTGEIAQMVKRLPINRNVPSSNPG